MTNFSQLHRETLAGWFGKGGLAIDPERIITGTSATAAHTASAHPGRPLFVLAAEDARREFDGQHLLTADEADAAPAGTVAAVVIGDAGDDLSYRNLDVAFRLVLGGAELLAMHRNPLVADAEGADARRRGVRGRARVRDRPDRPDAGQAIADRLPPGGRRAGRGPGRAAAAVRVRDGR